MSIFLPAFHRHLFGAGFFFQHPYLVAEDGRGLKIEIIGRRVHLRALFFDQLLQLLRAIDARVQCRQFGNRTRAPACDISHDVAYLFLDSSGSDPMLFVVFHLHRAPAVRLINRPRERARHHIGIEDDPSVDVARRAAYRLYERCLTPEESFFIRVQNADKFDFRQVQAFAQEIHPDEDVEYAFAEIRKYLDAFHRLHVAVQIARLYVLFDQEFREILGHLFGEHGNERAAAVLGRRSGFIDEIFHLSLKLPFRNHRPQDDLWIEQALRTDYHRDHLDPEV